MKIALVIGSNYNKLSHLQLNGCVNDARNVANTLQGKGFKTKLITWSLRKRGVSRHFREIIRLSRKKDVKKFVFFFSGHGTRLNKQKSELNDKLSEGLVVGVTRAEIIKDDEIVRLIKKIKAREKFVFIDACHSGTVGDLEFCILPKRFRADKKKARKQKILSLTACADKQYAIETAEFVPQGIFTRALVSAMRTSERKSMFKICQEVNDSLQNAQQVAQLCSSRKYKLAKKMKL